MSALSKPCIIKRLRKGELILSPILSDSQIGSSAVDLRLGNVAKMVRARGLSHVDPQKYLDVNDHNVIKGSQQKLERYEIPFKEPLLLHPGMLALVPTLEWVKLPDNLKGIVTARSCWAREGLSIATASFINPGYCGIITLELANLGQIPISLFPGMRLAQIAFFEITKPVAITEKSQFNLSFEPSAGNISTDDMAFIPRLEPKDKS
ncbi:dCTP deaminase [Pseudomonadota bacterium]